MARIYYALLPPMWKGEVTGSMLKFAYFFTEWVLSYFFIALTRHIYITLSCHFQKQEHTRLTTSLSKLLLGILFHTSLVESWNNKCMPNDNICFANVQHIWCSIKEFAMVHVVSIHTHTGTQTHCRSSLGHYWASWISSLLLWFSQAANFDRFLDPELHPHG